MVKGILFIRGFLLVASINFEEVSNWVSSVFFGKEVLLLIIMFVFFDIFGHGVSYIWSVFMLVCLLSKGIWGNWHCSLGFCY